MANEIGLEEEYTCSLCDETVSYEADWTEKDANEEYAEAFPEAINEPRAIVCEDCYMVVTSLIQEE